MDQALLRIPAYSRWLAGRCLTWFGDTVMVLVLSMWTKRLTGSSSQAGLTMALPMAPTLVAPASGLLVDRFPRHTAIVIGNTVSAIALLPLVRVRTPGDVWIIWGVAVLYGTSGAILPSASSALQRSIVPDDLLADAQGVQQSVATVLQLIAPIAGAALYTAWGGAGPNILAAASFIAGAMVFTRFREPPAQARRGEDTNL